MKKKYNRPDVFTDADPGLCAKVGNFALEQSSSPSDVYAVSGELYLSTTEACIFAATDDASREKIRRMFLDDLEKMREHIRTFKPPTHKEFHSENPGLLRNVRRQFNIDMWGED